jgi:hypothetical protein
MLANHPHGALLAPVLANALPKRSLSGPLSAERGLDKVLSQGVTKEGLTRDHQDSARSPHSRDTP